MLEEVPRETILKTPRTLEEMTEKSERYWIHKLSLSHALANALNDGDEEKARIMNEKLNELRKNYVEEAGLIALIDEKEHSEFVYAPEPLRKIFDRHPLITDKMEFNGRLKGTLLTYRDVTYDSQRKKFWFPTKISALREFIATLAKPGITFCSLGSGDARELFIADDYKVERAVGYEINTKLHNAALFLKDLYEEGKEKRSIELINDSFYNHNFSSADSVFVSLTNAQSECGEISRLLADVKPSCRIITVSWPLDEKYFKHGPPLYALLWDSEEQGVAPVFYNTRKI